MEDWPDRPMVDAPDGAEQADEGSCRAHGGQNGQARLQAGRELADAVAHAAGHPVADVKRVVQVGAGLAVVGSGFAAFEHQVAEGVGPVIAELFQAAGQVGAVPEVLGVAGVLIELHDVQGLDDHHQPRGHRHGQQDDGDGTGDEVSLRPDVGNAELGIHGYS